MLEAEGKVVEAHRLKQRTRFDLELMAEIGYCQGIENYSRHLDGRKPGTRPYTLMDYFPQDLLVVVDESHVTLPQLRAMYRGDRMRKETLIEHGFRLPSALDNRPLLFEEWESLCPSTLYVSATPGGLRDGADRGARSSSSSFVLPDCWIRPLPLCPPRARSIICWAKLKSDAAAANACW